MASPLRLFPLQSNTDWAGPLEARSNAMPSTPLDAPRAPGVACSVAGPVTCSPRAGFVRSAKREI